MSKEKTKIEKISSEKKLEDLASVEIEKTLNEGRTKDAMAMCLEFIRKSYGKEAVGVWILKYFCQNFISEDPGFRSPLDKNILRVMKKLPELWDCHGVNVFYTSEYFTTKQMEQIETIYAEFKNRRQTKNACKYFIDELKKIK